MDGVFAAGFGGGRLPRKRLFRAAAASAAFLVATSGAKKTPPALAAAPTAATAGTPVTFAAMYQAGLWDAQQTQIVLEAVWRATEPFRAQHPGIKLQMVQSLTPDVSPVDFTSGLAPDVVIGWDQFSALANNGFLLDLTPYVQASNSPLDVWATSAISGYEIVGRLYALPFYSATSTMIANLTLADQLGIKRPEPGWTWEDWVGFWRATTVRSGKTPRAGGGIYFTGTGIAELYFLGWGGHIMDPAQPARCVLASPQAQTTATQIIPLVQAGICSLNYVGGGQVENILRGTQASMVYWDAALAVTSDILAMSQMSHSMSWDFFPMPQLPYGTFSYTQRVFRAINASSKYPEAAWEVLQWLVYDPSVQRMLMQFGLEPPALKSLQEEYVSVIQRTVPPLRNKNLNAIIQPILDNAIYPEPEIPYFETEAKGLISSGEMAMINHQLDITGGLRQVAARVNALEAAGATAAGGGNAATLLARLNAAARTDTPLAPPQKTGTGAAPSPLPAAYLTVLGSGRYRLTGDGADVWNPTTNCVFAGSASTAPRLTLTCRVTQLANVDCPHLSQWAKVGLMVCGDLSDTAAAMTIEVTGGNGVFVQNQWAPQGGWAAVGPASATAPTGLLGPAVITRPNTSKQANYLLRPVWLRLVRDGAMWSAFTSLNGTDWSPAGAPVGLEIAGAWVGLFATAHNDSFGGKGLIQATFDHVSFPVTAGYQIGAA